MRYQAALCPDHVYLHHWPIGHVFLTLALCALDGGRTFPIPFGAWFLVELMAIEIVHGVGLVNGPFESIEGDFKGFVAMLRIDCWH